MDNLDSTNVSSYTKINDLGEAVHDSHKKLKEVTNLRKDICKSLSALRHRLEADNATIAKMDEISQSCLVDIKSRVRFALAAMEHPDTSESRQLVIDALDQIEILIEDAANEINLEVEEVVCHFNA